MEKRMRGSPKGFRLHIGLFGRRNVGKSSLLNALTRQQVSIVSDVAGTTTDPVEKPMELLPIGPVLFIDTAGIDDTGALGGMRVGKTRQAIDRTDVGIIVSTPVAWGEFEREILRQFEERRIPVVVVLNQSDLFPSGEQPSSELEQKNVPVVRTVATEGRGIPDLREALIRAAPEELINQPAMVGDLVRPGDLVVLVTPIDLEAPKGRLILPQVQTIRDLLDHDALCMVLKEGQLRKTLESLPQPPALVVTDSQVFLQVAAETPPDVRMTSFSILYARNKGDLGEFVRGALAIDALQPGSRVLIAEACTHHPIGDDIGRVKIPQWLTRHVGGDLEFTHVQGRDFPDDPSPWDLVIHCGACVWNRREVLSRIVRCRKAGVPLTNYGMAIAWSLGVFERALEPFPGALEVYRSERPEKKPVL